MKVNEIYNIEKSAWGQSDVDDESNSIRRSLVKKPNTKGDFGKHKLVPVTGLPEGFYLTYQKTIDKDIGPASDKFIVSLVDARENINKPNVVSYMWFHPETVYFNEPNYSSITGLKVGLLGTTSEYKGHGYAIQVYKMLVDHGQIIFSDTSQTPDGTKVWRKLLSSGEYSGWGLQIDSSSSTRDLINAYPINSNNLNEVVKIVFQSWANQFVLVPTHDTQTIELLKTKTPKWFK